MTIKTVLVCLAVTALLALKAGMVLAETVQDTNGRDLLAGTPKADEIRGLEGPDDLLGRGADEPHG